MALTTLARNRVFSFSHVVGRSTDQPPPGFGYPYGVTFGKSGIAYVVSRGVQGLGYAPWVAKLKIGEPGEEEYLATIGHRDENGQGQVVWMADVAVDDDDLVYISDEYMQRILIFDGEGKPLGTWGAEGSGPGEFHGPCGLAFDAENNLYVVDSLNHRVQKFTRDGTFLSGWGEYGGGEGEFNMPWGITVDTTGNVYVADWKNHRVQQFTPEGEFIRHFGRPAPGAGDLRYPRSFPRDVQGGHMWRREGDGSELNHPAHVAVDRDGDVYVTDWANSRVQIYMPDGEFITSLYGDAREPGKWAEQTLDANPDARKAFRRATHPEDAWRFRMPSGIAIDLEANRIVVCDTIKLRTQVYVKETDYSDAEFNL